MSEHMSNMGFDLLWQTLTLCCLQAHSALADIPPVAATAALPEPESALVLQPTPPPARPLTAVQIRSATPTFASEAPSVHDVSAQPTESVFQADIITKVTPCSPAVQPAVSVSHERVTVLCAVLLCMLRWSLSTLTCIYHKGGVVTSTWYEVLGSKCIAAATGVRRAALYSSSVLTDWGLAITATAAPCVSKASGGLNQAFAVATQLNNSAHGAATTWMKAVAIMFAGLHAGLRQTVLKILCFSTRAKADWRLVLSIVGCVGLMVFVRCLMDWVWDLSLLIVPPAICAVVLQVVRPAQVTSTTRTLVHASRCCRSALLMHGDSAYGA